jgi:hypothetical protein
MGVYIWQVNEVVKEEGQSQGIAVNQSHHQYAPGRQP